MSKSVLVDLYHTGIGVASLDEAMATFSETFGTTWRPIQVYGPLDLWTSEGVRHVEELRVVYSVKADPYVEFIEHTGDPVWGAGNPGGEYHLGYWTDDLAGDTQILESQGYVRVLCDITESGIPELFAYFRSPVGPVVELLPRSRMAQVLSLDS